MDKELLVKQIYEYVQSFYKQIVSEEYALDQLLKSHKTQGGRLKDLREKEAKLRKLEHLPRWKKFLVKIITGVKF